MDAKMFQFADEEFYDVPNSNGLKFPRFDPSKRAGDRIVLETMRKYLAHSPGHSVDKDDDSFQ